MTICAGRVRVGATLSIPVAGERPMKFSSSGTTTRRGADFNTFNATWQLVLL